MDIKISEESIAQAINESATKALSSSLGGWEVQSAISKVVTQQVAEGAIADAIKDAVSQVNVDILTKKLAEEMQRATIKATVAILQEGLITTICKLRGIGDYSAEDKKERARLKAELFSS